jgi:hypothetical protein
VARHIFKLARCGYTLRVTSQTSYSPEYITPTPKKKEKNIPTIHLNVIKQNLTCLQSNKVQSSIYSHYLAYILH